MDAPSLPRFLIIGAMKAGTTTLYRDMLASMDVFLPADKEPEAFVTEEVLTPRGRARYASLFAGARPGQLCGEASTAYTKRPDHQGVADRVRRLLGKEVRLIYLMRHPVQRVASQLRHEAIAGTVAGDPALVVRAEPRFVAYSRYAYQLEPWLDCFGGDALCPLTFEEYVADRPATLRRVATFIGTTFDADRVASDRVYNRSDAKPVVTGAWKRVYASPLYRQVVRPWLSAEARERLRRLVLPKAQPPPVRFDDATHRYLVDQLAPDVDRLHTLLGPAAPRWDLERSTSGDAE